MPPSETWMNSVLPTEYLEIGINLMWGGEERIMIRFTNGHVKVEELLNGKLKKTVNPRAKQAKFKVTVT